MAQANIKQSIEFLQYQKYMKFTLDQAVGSLDNVFWCPTPDCKFAFDPDG